MIDDLKDIEVAEEIAAIDLLTKMNNSAGRLHIVEDHGSRVMVRWVNYITDGDTGELIIDESTGSAEITKPFEKWIVVK